MRAVFLMIVVGLWTGTSQARKPNPTLELKSTWGSCSTGTFAAPFDGSWSRPIVTSEWDGAPWSCLSARIKPRHPRAKFKMEIKSKWGAGCLAGSVAKTGFTPKGSGLKTTKWSKPVVTSEWNGSPWGCISVRLKSKNTNARCQVSLRSDWGSCSTSNVSSRDGQWSRGIITSEWDGAPWSCLKAKIECRGGETQKPAKWIMETAGKRELQRFGKGPEGRKACRRALRERQCVERRNRRAVCVKYRGQNRLDNSEFGPLNCR